MLRRLAEFLIVCHCCCKEYAYLLEYEYLSWLRKVFARASTGSSWNCTGLFPEAARPAANTLHCFSSPLLIAERSAAFIAIMQVHVVFCGVDRSYDAHQRSLSPVFVIPSCRCPTSVGSSRGSAQAWPSRMSAGCVGALGWLLLQVFAYAALPSRGPTTCSAQGLGCTFACMQL